MLKSVDSPNLTIKEVPAWRVVGRMALLLSAAALIPSLGLSQEVTGPLVNALLILSVGLVGVGNAILVGLVPSFVAWSRGILPAPMVVMIPYIVLGNAVLILTYAAFRRRHYWAGVLAGAALKCAFLWGAVTLVARVPVSIQIGAEVTPVQIQPAFALMFQYPQFLTAVAGGAMAWGALEGYRLLRRRGVIP